jgi:hypothetical protein
MFEFMNRIPSLVRVPLRFGFIGGILGFTLLIVLYYIGRHPFLVIPLFDFRVALFGIFIYFILKELRDDNFKGVLFFGQGMAASGIFVITFGIIASLLVWIFAANVPGFVREYVELATNQLNTYPKETIEQIGRARYEEGLTELKATTPAVMAKLYFRNGILIGFFIGMILSVILRRQPQTFNN